MGMGTEETFFGRFEYDIEDMSSGQMHSLYPQPYTKPPNLTNVCLNFSNLQLQFFIGIFLSRS